MDKAFEKELRETVESLLKTGRDGDWDHVVRAVDFGRYLLLHEQGDEDIVIPALYLHDIGWSQIDFFDFTNAAPAQAEKTKSESLHMEYGAALARNILKDMNYPPGKSSAIVSIIAVHDLPDKIFAMNKQSALLVMESDRLDRYGLESLKRFESMFGPEYLKGGDGQEWIFYLRNGLKTWFRTKTGKALAEQLAVESGIFTGI